MNNPIYSHLKLKGLTLKILSILVCDFCDDKYREDFIPSEPSRYSRDFSVELNLKLTLSNQIRPNQSNSLNVFFRLFIF